MRHTPVAYALSLFVLLVCLLLLGLVLYRRRVGKLRPGAGPPKALAPPRPDVSEHEEHALPSVPELPPQAPTESVAPGPPEEPPSVVAESRPAAPQPGDPARPAWAPQDDTRESARVELPQPAGVVRGKSIKTLRAQREGPPYPVVLVHGVLGFEAIEVGNLRQEYFRGVARRLRAKGVRVHVPRVSPVGSIEVRARQLAQQIQQLRASKVNIVAHSMGGLDARLAISCLGIAGRVASLTTIGTPHTGTPLADFAVRVVADRLHLRRMIRRLGAEAFDDLTTAKMAEFNERVRDVPGVAYRSYLGSLGSALDGLNVLLMPGYVYLGEAGPNDGIVPEDAQRWGDVMGRVGADHWAQVGWSRSFDARPFYERIVMGLQNRGM